MKTAAICFTLVAAGLSPMLAAPPVDPIVVHPVP